MSWRNSLNVLAAFLTAISFLSALAPAARAGTAANARAAATHNAAAPANVSQTIAGVRPNREVVGFAFGNASLGDATYGYPAWSFNLLTHVVYFGLSIDWDGTIIQNGSGWTTWNSTPLTGLVSTAHSWGTKVILSIDLHDGSTSSTSTMCAALHPLHRAVTVSQAMAQLNAMQVDGINLNYEGSSVTCAYGATTRSEMTSLASEMRAALPAGDYLSVDTYSGSAGDPTNFFDLAAMAPYVDTFMVMTYDMEYSNQYYAPVNCSGSQSLNCLSPTSPLTSYYYNDRDVMASYISTVGANKVLLGVPYYGRKACVAAAVANAVPTSSVITESYVDTSSEAADPSVQSGTYAVHRDAYTGAERWDTWYNASLGCTREMYWDDVYSLGRKYDLVNSDNLRGIGIFTLQYGAGSPELWNVLAAKFTNWSASYDMSQAPASLQPGETRSFTIKVTNPGPATWPAGGNNYTALDLHLTTAPGGSAQISKWITSDVYRLTADLAPAQTVSFSVTVTAPMTPGPLWVEAEMFTNQLYWFSAWQASPVRIAGVLWFAGYDLTAAPTTWGAGQTATFTVTVKNSGNQTWRAGGANPVALDLNFALRPAGSASINGNWLTSQIFNLSADVPAGGSAQLNVSVTAPSVSGPLYLEAQMFKNQQFWFPTWQPVAVSVGATGAAWSASFDLSAVPRMWQTSQAQTFAVTIKNTGSQAWPASGTNNVALDVNFSTRPGGSAVLYSSWLSSTIVSLPSDVAPGGSVTLNVSAAAPAQPGAMYLEAQMFKNQQFWFSSFAPVAVAVGPVAWSAGLALSAAPVSWSPGQTQTFAITVTNTGTQPWPATGANNVALDVNFSTTAGGSNDVYTAWLTSQIVNLPSDVVPGAQIPISLTVTAPMRSGPLYLEVQMFKNQQFWFPTWQFTPVQVIGRHWWAAIDMSAAPSAWTAGQTQTFTVAVKNVGNETWPAGGANPVALDLHFTTHQGGDAVLYTSWLTSDIFSLPSDVAPGQSVQISVTITAPRQVGSPYLEAEVFKNQQFWIPSWQPAAVTVS